MDAALRHLHNARATMLFLEVDELNIPALGALSQAWLQAGWESGLGYYETAAGRSAALTMRRDLKAEPLT